MKPEVFERPTLVVERHRLREGPPIHYVCWQPTTSCFCADRLSVLRFAKWPKGTSTGDALREWLDQFIDADAALHAKVGAGLELDMKQIKAEGWGPEAHHDEEPQANTKMIT